MGVAGSRPDKSRVTFSCCAVEATEVLILKEGA